jgi:L-glyceraldehyde 3-phosphate reductase
VHCGKALYAGISNYDAPQSAQAIALLRSLGVPCLIHQAKYSMLNRWTEEGLLDVLEKEGTGCICFSPLAQGLLSEKYLHSIPENSRAAKDHFLKADSITPELRKKLVALNDMAKETGRALAAMAIQWILRDARNTSVLIGASSSAQLMENIAALSQPPLSTAELERIESIIQ